MNTLMKVFLLIIILCLTSCKQDKPERVKKDQEKTEKAIETPKEAIPDLKSAQAVLDNHVKTKNLQFVQEAKISYEYKDDYDLLAGTSFGPTLKSGVECNGRLLYSTVKDARVADIMKDDKSLVYTHKALVKAKIFSHMKKYNYKAFLGDVKGYEPDGEIFWFQYKDNSPTIKKISQLNIKKLAIEDIKKAIVNHDHITGKFIQDHEMFIYWNSNDKTWVIEK